MTHATCNPLVEVRVTHRREEAVVILCLASRWNSCYITSLLLLLLSLSPLLFRSLALLTIVDEEGEGQREPHDDNRVYQPIIVFSWIVGRVSTRHCVVVDVVVQIVAVVKVILDKIVDPFAEGPIFLIFCSWYVSIKK